VPFRAENGGSVPADKTLHAEASKASQGHLVAGGPGFPERTGYHRKDRLPLKFSACQVPLERASVPSCFWPS
jgi:hypothetical protein